MLFIDRNYGGHFFDPATGGNAVLWQNIFWFYSHPAVYVMVLPAMGIVSEILPVFSRKPLFGYKAFVFATAGDRRARLLGLGPPHVHDRRGLPAVLQLHDVPHRDPDRGEDVQLDRDALSRPADASRRRCCSRSGFLTMFLIGGINGAFSAAVPVDFALHDTYWVVAHIHYVLFGGSVFGVFAGRLLLVPEDDRPDAQRDARQDPVRADVHRVQPDVLPDAPARPVGMPRRIADYARRCRLERPEPRLHDRRLPDRGEHDAVPVERVRVAARAARSRATTHGRATRSSGRRPRRRRRTTSTASRRSTPSARCSTCATAGSRPTATPPDAGPDASEPPDADRSRHDRRRARADHDRAHARSPGLAHDTRRRDQQPDPRDAAVHHLRGDVLRGPVRGLLQRPGQRPGLAADEPGFGDTAPRSCRWSGSRRSS